MPIKDNVFYADKDYHGKRPDGRTFLIIAKGQKTTVPLARNLGLLSGTEAPIPFAMKPEGLVPDGDKVEQVFAGMGMVEKPVKINATKAAIKAAEANFVDLTGVNGSGADGRILVEDVMNKLIEEEE